MNQDGKESITNATMTKSNPELREEMLTEYGALRSEILKRMDMRHQVLTFTIVIAGTLFTFGTNVGSVIVLLIYPLLAAFLALVWMHNDVRAGELGSYIRDHIETQLKGVNWENYITELKQKQLKDKNSLVKAAEISATGVFLFAECLALVLAFPRLTGSLQEIVLFIADIGAIVLTVVFLRRRRNQKASERS